MDLSNIIAKKKTYAKYMLKEIKKILLLDLGPLLEL